ncbi:erythromycin esterase family protein [Flavobacterium sp. LB3R33]
MTERLIQEKRFSFVGVEEDWPDCYRLNRYV